MSQLNSRWWLLGCVSVITGPLLACGGDTENISPPGPDASSPDTASDGAITDTLVADTSKADAAKNGCSNDLRDILDPNGNVLMTCPPDQGCANGGCMPACDAAALNSGTIGCDFLVPTPSFYPTIKPPCFAVFIANSWPSDVKLTVTLDGTNYDVTKFGYLPAPGQPEKAWAPIPSTGIPAGKAAVLFLSHDPASANVTPLTCPVAPAISQAGGSALPGSGTLSAITARGKAWHIAANVPITAYDILPYGGAKSYLPSAEVLFPSTSFGTSYIGVVPIHGTSMLPEWGQLVAVKDNTNVTVTPTVDLPSGTNVVAAPKGKATKFTLAAGEFIQWQESGEMSGSVITADAPISFTGGHTYNCYKSATSSGGGCDSAHQQIPPLAALGAEYVAPPYATRLASLAEESIKYRIVGAVDNTTLTYLPAVANAPATINAGQVLDFEAVGPFTITSQGITNPFYVGQTMSGCLLIGAARPPGGCLGDEEFVNLLPPAQYLSKYVFFTDPTYPTTNLVFVRVKGAQGFQDVSLDCLGTLSGWKPVNTNDNYEILDVDLVRGGTKNGNCDNGGHTASSKAPFGLMVWGLDTYSSYAYPAGGNAGIINKVQ